ncbi:MAG: hypothetical protein LBI02_04640 [Opitutaceae bacterium]|jgi:hypothetical protein|nr:hypothetical protein [Opitutaceae bacterium]
MKNSGFLNFPKAPHLDRLLSVSEILFRPGVVLNGREGVKRKTRFASRARARPGKWRAVVARRPLCVPSTETSRRRGNAFAQLQMAVGFVYQGLMHDLKVFSFYGGFENSFFSIRQIHREKPRINANSRG